MVDLNRTQTALEFDKIKNILAEVCPTDGSKELAISLEPFIYEDEVRRSLKRTSEAKEMMTTKGMPPFGHFVSFSMRRTYSEQRAHSEITSGKGTIRRSTR